ncbi:hypothetical protein [Pseudonocardia sp. ICBG601]|uniref:hypothetical protein n=1 Tax=Pseudonocardia sp. ICBG601 TaxID=2846759 RepID=UPI001CF68E43|nr:hypothetical protein [Pseudonocardia sp. ICBG601]
MRWRDGLPGRGAGGGRPSTLRLEYYAEAAARGLDDEEAAHTLAAFGNSFPEMSEQEIMAWLVRSWRE